MREINRISLGDCSCSGPPDEQDVHKKEICFHISKVLEHYVNEGEFKAADAGKVKIRHFVEELEDTRLLVVAQGRLPTFNKPNYFSIRFIGRLYAEGILMEKDGRWGKAPDEYLWKYR